MAYAFLKIHTPLEKRIRSLGLGLGFKLVGLSIPPSQTHCSKLYCDKQDSIIIKTRDFGFW